MNLKTFLTKVAMVNDLIYQDRLDLSSGNRTMFEAVKFDCAVLFYKAE